MALRSNLSLILLASLVCASVCSLPGKASPSFGTDIGYARIVVADRPFEVWLSQTQVGYTLVEHMAVELRYATTVVDDDEVGLTAAVSSHYGVDLRWLPFDFSTTRPYAALGYARTKVELRDHRLRTRISDVFRGLSVTAGIEERVLGWPNLWITAAGFTWIEQNDLTLRGLSLGVRYAF